MHGKPPPDSVTCPIPVASMQLFSSPEQVGICISVIRTDGEIAMPDTIWFNAIINMPVTFA